MTMRDLHNNTQIIAAVAPQTITSSAIVSGNLDIIDWNAAEIEVHPGAIDGLNAGSPTGGTVAVKLEHADDNAGVPGTYANVEAKDVLGVDTVTAGVIATLSETVTGIVQRGYVGDKRFLRLTLTPAGLGAGGPIEAQVIKGHPRHAGQ